MQQLIKVVLLVCEKYKDKMNVIISGDVLTLEYLHYINGEQDVFKTIEVTEFEDKLSVKFIPERITKLINLNELEEIFEILERQVNHKKHCREKVKIIKEKYVVGTKLELIKMYDYINPVKKGITGVVTNVDDTGTIHVAWENGSTLGLVVGVDEFKIIE